MRYCSRGTLTKDAFLTALVTANGVGIREELTDARQMTEVSADGAAIARLILGGTSTCLVPLQTAVTALSSETAAALRAFSREVSTLTTTGASSIETVAGLGV